MDLKSRHPADTTFSGFGLWDVFAPGRRLVGTVAADLSHPPFVAGDGKEFDFAPGHFLFAYGLIVPGAPIAAASVLQDGFTA